MLDPYKAQVNEALMLIYNSIRKVEDRMLQSSVLDLSISELDVVEIAGKHGGEGATIGGIARELGVTLPTVTVAVKRLESKGYVEKVRSVTDGRSVKVVLTRKGIKADAAHRYFHERMVRSFLKDADDGDQEALLKALVNLGGFLKMIGEADL